MTTASTTLLIFIASTTILCSRTNAFVPVALVRDVNAIAYPRCSSTSLLMGKSTTRPGPAGKASSGPSASEYRQKKMNDRLAKKNNKKKVGFGSVDNEKDDSEGSKKPGPVMEIELKAEPEGGEEVSPLAAAENTGDYVVRLKDMGAVDSSDPAYDLKESLGAEVHNFWLTALADGKAIQKTRNVVMRDAAKNADFPGFRKGQVPPYAQPKMTNFALQEVIVSSCQEALKKFGVKDLPEDAGEVGAVTFNEDVQDISQRYDTKRFPSVPYTASFRAYHDSDAIRESSAPEGVTETAEAVDAECVETESDGEKSD